MRSIFQKKPIVRALIGVLGTASFGFMIPDSFATDYQLGDYSLSVNSTVSVGTSFRAESQDPALYSSGNRNSDGVVGRGATNTMDDGELNFNKGDTFSTIIKGVHDFDLKKDNYGFFGRVKWFYDQTMNNKTVYHGHEANGYTPNTELNDSKFNPYARFDGIDVLDAFGYIKTSIADKPLDVRLGRQVVSWGESTLIPSAISGLNPTDVSALRRPGAEVKEGFTPSEMLYANFGLTDDTSVEGFLQLKWRKTVPEGCGTYFSTSDFMADGCSRLFFNQALPDASGSAFAVNRSKDVQPDDKGQFGLAFRSYVQSLDTEFGAYAMNYHSRLPMASLRKGSNANSTFGAASDASYVVEYPENIAVLGLSFATDAGGWSWSGEVSQAKDMPIQINAVDLLRSGLTNGNTNGYAGSASGFGGPSVPADLNTRVSSAPLNSVVHGYDRFDVTQLQTSVVKTFDQVLGASQVALVGEVGAVWVNGLPDVNTGIRYGRASVFGSGFNSTKDGFVTPFSWGYRLRASATYRNAIGEIDLIPSLAFSSDVKGYSPEPGQVFNEGRQAVGVGLMFEFDANTKASINYVTYANSAGYDPLRDRDYISVSASYSF